MITTLTKRDLVDITTLYTFYKGKLTIIINTLANHNVFGEVNMIMSNAILANIVTKSEGSVPDFFNQARLFKVNSPKQLIHTVDILSGINPSAESLILQNNGAPIEVEVDNLSVIISNPGVYTSRLIDDASSIFDGARVTLQEQAILNAGNSNSYNGITDEYAEIADANYQTIDNQELTFDFAFKVGVTNETLNTNIPISFRI
jgi:hypothetical protein